MRALLVVLAMLLAPAVQAAPVFEEPRDLLEYAYQPYRDGSFPDDPFELWSPALLERWALMVARTPEGEVGAVGFDPMINAQDYELGDVAIGEPVFSGDRAIVTARFDNFGSPQEIRFVLVEGPAGWKIEDIESLTPGYEWRLSEILGATSE